MVSGRALIFISVFIIPPLRRRREYFVLALSIHNQYFLSPSITNIFQSHFSQQLCITALSNLVWCFAFCYGSYMLLTEFMSAIYLLPVLRLFIFQHNMVKCQIFVALFSAITHHSHFKLGVGLLLGVLHVAY